MRKSTLKIVLSGIAAVSLGSGAAFGQGGGNGQGGSGGGNAHGAATAGMTHWGDPAPSPLDVMPGNKMQPRDSTDSNQHRMPPDDSTTRSKTGQ